MHVKRFDAAVCGCCGRAAHGIGYAPKPDKPVLWLCDDRECIDLARDTYFMKQEDFDSIETLAVREGGFAAGEYLNAIGKTDLSQLTEPEWNEFCRRVVTGYRKELVRSLSDKAAPF